MYINELGTRNIGNAFSYGNSSRRTSALGSFANELQKVLENRNTAGKADSDSAQSDGHENSCCKQCDLNSQLLSRMMVQNLFMRSGMGGLGLTGFSSLGTSALTASAYGSMMNLFGSSL